MNKTMSKLENCCTLLISNNHNDEIIDEIIDDAVISTTFGLIS